MSQYIDLEEQVSDYYGTFPGQARRAGICDALRYIDSHPEHVPGRTIKESELENSSARTGISQWAIRAIAGELGITIVPDSEPTNAEKLEGLFAELMKRQMTYRAAGEWLDSRGVKAPGDES